MLGFDPASNKWSVFDGQRVLPLHESFQAASIQSVDDVVWVDGLLDGVRTVVLLDTSGGGLAIARTTRITNEADSSVVLTSAHTLVVASRGSLFRARLPG
jgi:hypothetical protein